jgi:hypothetical protein
MRGSRWKIIRPGQDAKSTYKVKHIQHLKDVDDLVEVADDIFDPIEKRRSLLQRVQLNNKVGGGQGVPTKLDLESEASKYRIAIGVPRKRPLGGPAS